MAREPIPEPRPPETTEPMLPAAPDRVPLANLPTPLERSVRMGQRLGVELYWKRDDLSGCELSGNKVRKLEYLLADARSRGADVVITCGGAQSNHCRATALAAARLGLGCVVLLRVAEPERPPPLDANSLLDRLAGAEIRWLSVDEYRRRTEIFRRVEAELKARGRRPYSIPEGGSNEIGAWGYMMAMSELRQQLPDGPVTIVYAAGSGGTGAGIELGIRLLGWKGARAVGFAVCDDRAYFQGAISAIIHAARTRYGLESELVEADIAPERLEIDDGFIGPGYARSTPEMLQAIAEVARTDGIVLDPVYTGKAFFGLKTWLARDPRRYGPRVVFLHTGGIFGLFPFAAELRGIL